MIQLILIHLLRSMRKDYLLVIIHQPHYFLHFNVQISVQYHDIRLANVKMFQNSNCGHLQVQVSLIQLCFIYFSIYF